MGMEPLTVAEVLAALRRQPDSSRMRIRKGSMLSAIVGVALVVAGEYFQLSRWYSEVVPAPDQRVVVIRGCGLTKPHLTAGELDTMICQLHEPGITMHDLVMVLEIAPGIGAHFNLMCLGKRWLLEPTRL